VGERFALPDGRVAVFRRSDARKGKVYHVAVSEMPGSEDATN
jgi:hypothetical protein